MVGILGTILVWGSFVRGNAFVDSIYAREVGNTSSLRQLLRDTQYSAHSLISVAIVIALLTLQIALVLKGHPSWHRWTPVVVDVSIGFAFALASTQMTSTSLLCVKGTTCTATWPSLFPAWWIAVCSGVGAVLGVVWATGLENERVRRRGPESVGKSDHALI